MFHQVAAEALDLEHSVMPSMKLDLIWGMPFPTQYTYYLGSGVYDDGTCAVGIFHCP